MATVTVEAFSAASVAPSSASEMVVGEAVSDRTGKSSPSVRVTSAYYFVVNKHILRRMAALPSGYSDTDQSSKTDWFWWPAEMSSWIFTPGGKAFVALVDVVVGDDSMAKVPVEQNAPAGHEPAALSRSLVKSALLNLSCRLNTPKSPGADRRIRLRLARLDVQKSRFGARADRSESSSASTHHIHTSAGGPHSRRRS